MLRGIRVQLNLFALPCLNPAAPSKPRVVVVPATSVDIYTINSLLLLLLPLHGVVAHPRPQDHGFHLVFARGISVPATVKEDSNVDFDMIVQMVQPMIHKQTLILHLPDPLSRKTILPNYQTLLQTRYFLQTKKQKLHLKFTML